MPSTPSSARPDPEPARRPRIGLALLLGCLLAGVLAYVLATTGDDDDSSAGPAAATVDPRESDVSVPGVAEPGDPAPPFELESLAGSRIGLADYGGRPVLVNFWASWCIPCRAEFPLLAEALADHEGDGLAVLGVIYDDLERDARDFADELGADWPLLLDPDRGTATAYGVRAIPQTFFVAPDGTIAARVFGITSADELEASIRTILDA